MVWCRMYGWKPWDYDGEPFTAYEQALWFRMIAAEQEASEFVRASRGKK